MQAFLWTACGTQYPPSDAAPEVCLICTDERQFVPASGQSWTTLERLRTTHSNKLRRAPTAAAPEGCLTCPDERQFVPASGQSWTTLERLRTTHSNKFRRLATGLTTKTGRA